MIDNPNSPWWSLGLGLGAPSASSPHIAPRVIAILGARQGVGGTTVAIGLVETLARLGQRVAIVDADRHRPQVASRCGLSTELTLANLLEEGRDIHEILQRGPAGSLAVAGKRNLENITPQARADFVHQVRSLGRHVETVVLDAGDGRQADQRSLAESTDAAIVVTTTEADSIVDAYAVLKLLSSQGFAGRLGVVVNKATSASGAQAVADRLNACCEQFLGKTLAVALAISADPLHASNDRQRLAGVVAGWPMPRMATAAEPLKAAARMGRLDEVC